MVKGEVLMIVKLLSSDGYRAGMSKLIPGLHCNIRIQKNFQRAADLKKSPNFTAQEPFYIIICLKISKL